MPETIEEKIDRFVKYNEDLIEQIMSIYCPKDNGIYAKVLLCSLFDSLAKCAYPDAANGERFKNTITTHTQWEDAERVSLLHLVRAFEVTENLSEDFLDLKKELNSLFSTHFNPHNGGMSQEIAINIDLLYSEIEKKWPKNSKGNLIQLGEVTLEKLQHKNLLWLYRNSIVHEFRIPGSGKETISFMIENPCYQAISIFFGNNIKDFKIVHKNFELHYPINFLKQMCKESLYSIAQEYRDKGESPFKVYSEGEYWIPKFNE